MSNFHENSNDGSTGRFSPELVGRLRTELLDLGESERYRLFSSLLAELAEHQQSSNNGRESAEQAAAVSKRLQTVSEEAATLRHEISTLKADLEHHSKQLASETA